MPPDSVRGPSSARGQLEGTLGLGASHRRRRWMVWGWTILCLLGLGGAIGAWTLQPRQPVGPRFETQAVERGNLRVTVTATGTLSARDAVQVGAEISGRVVKVLVDFNDRVKAGDVLAEIDPEQYRARLDEASAQLAASLATKAQAQATAQENELKIGRLRSMFDAGLSAQQELEAAEASYQRARISVSSANAQITSAQASLKVAKSNLGRAVIHSPIDGIVLDRSVEPGQTVTSGLQTPVLFTLAADLSELRLDVKVDEADVGQVGPGQEATFTVDAYPNRTFASKVLAVKNMPTTTQNVVTYETRLSAKNEQGLLKPGMTATATILVDDQKDVVLIPNSALRFTPPQPKTASAKSVPISKLFSGPPRLPRRSVRAPDKPSPSASAEGGDRSKAPRHVVWVLKEGRPVAIPVQIGATDGARTILRHGDLAPGTQVIINQVSEPNG